MNQRGITLIALAVTIIVMIIIGGVGVSIGTTIINTARLKEMATNMLLVQAKVKGDAEKYSFDDTSIELKGVRVEDDINELIDVEAIPTEQDTTLVYTLSIQDLEQFGINIKLKEEQKFIVDYGATEVEVYYLPGYKHKGNMYYTLTEILEINVNEEI